MLFKKKNLVRLGGAATLGILGGGGFGVRGDVIICGGGVGCAVARGDGAPALLFNGVVFCLGGIIIGIPIIIANNSYYVLKV